MRGKKTVARLFGAAALMFISLLPFVGTAVPAHAATVTFDWTLTGPAASLGGFPFTGSGTITAAVAATGGDALTAITGTIGSSAITGLATFDGADNLLFPNTASTSLLDTK